MEQWTRPNVGLSGGWDSRVVVSLLLDLGADMSLRVRGSPERYDVMIANELAQIAGLRLRINNTGGYPPEDLDQLRTCMKKALLSLRNGLSRWEKTIRQTTEIRQSSHLPRCSTGNSGRSRLESVTDHL